MTREAALEALDRIKREFTEGDYYDGVTRGTHVVYDDLATIRAALSPSDAAASAEREELAQALESARLWLSMHTKRTGDVAALAAAIRLLRESPSSPFASIPTHEPR